MEYCKLTDKEFKIATVRMVVDMSEPLTFYLSPSALSPLCLRKKTEKGSSMNSEIKINEQKYFAKDTEILKKNMEILELKNSTD